MTDDWFNDLYHQAGLDIYEANVKRLVFEFRYLGQKIEETQYAQTEADHSASGDETT